jgi:hypothetical protein
VVGRRLPGQIAFAHPTGASVKLAEAFEAFTFSPLGAAVRQFGAAHKELQAFSLIPEHGDGRPRGDGRAPSPTSPLTKSCSSDSVALLSLRRISDGDGTIGRGSG